MDYHTRAFSSFSGMSKLVVRKLSACNLPGVETSLLPTFSVNKGIAGEHNTHFLPRLFFVPWKIGGSFVRIKNIT